MSSLTEESKRRAVDAAVASLVGDAAALGLHWVYGGVDPKFNDAPEFVEPDAANFVDADGKRTGYFAHGRKRAGDLTHSGYGSLTVLRALAASGPRLDLAKHGELFAADFGPGGNYVGYVDHPSKSLLKALAEIPADAEERPVTGDPKEVQMNGLAASLPVAALQAGLPQAEWEAEVERTVRAIQNNDESVEYVLSLGRILRRVIAGGVTPREATLAEHRERTRGRVAEVDEKFDAAVERAAASDDTTAATAEWGKPCYLRMGVPSILHTLLTAKDFADAVRKAILAGGDSAPRAAVVASIFAAADGLPAEWAAKTSDAAEARKLAEAAVGA